MSKGILKYGIEILAVVLVLGSLFGLQAFPPNGPKTEITDADGDTKWQAEESTDEDILRADVAGEEKITISSTSLDAAVDIFVADTKGIVVGHTAKILASNTSEFQVLGTSGADASIVFARFTANNKGPQFNFLKSRSATIGINGIVLDNDVIGQFKFLPDDGADYSTQAALFYAEVDDASPALGDIGAAFVWELMPGGGLALREVMRLAATGFLGLGTAVPDELFHMAGAVDGRFTGLLIENTQADAGGSTNETAEILFGFADKNNVARITADKLDDYTTTAKEDSRLGFWVDIDGTLTEIFHVMNDGIMLMLDAPKIRFAATAGGSGSIQYKALSGSNRSAFLLAGNNVVVVNSRGVDGIVEIRANTSTGGAAGEVTVAEFQDDQITLLASNGSVGIGGTPNVKRQLDLVGLFNGNTRLSLTDTLSADADAQQLFIGGNVEAALDSDAHGLRIAPTLTKFGSGTHADFASLTIAPPTIIANGAALEIVSTLNIEGVPTGGTDNYALFVSGLTRIDGVFGSTVTTIDVDGATTFAATRNVINLTCTGAETITTITIPGGFSGAILTIIHEDGDCTLIDSDNNAVNQLDLAGTLKNLVGKEDLTLTLVRVASHWLQTSKSVN